MLADAGDDVLQHAAPGMMIENVIGGDQRNEIVGRDAGELRHPPPVVAAIEKAGRKPDRAFRGMLLQLRRAMPRACAASMRAGGITIRLRPSMPLEQIRQMQDAVAFLRFQLSLGKQLRQPSPGGAVGRIGENVGRAVGKDQTRADREPQALVLGDRHARAPRPRPNCGRRCRCRQGRDAAPVPPALRDARPRAGRRNWW